MSLFTVRPLVGATVYQAPTRTHHPVTRQALQSISSRIAQLQHAERVYVARGNEAPTFPDHTCYTLDQEDWLHILTTLADAEELSSKEKQVIVSEAMRYIWAQRKHRRYIIHWHQLRTLRRKA